MGRFDDYHSAFRGPRPRGFLPPQQVHLFFSMQVMVTGILFTLLVGMLIFFLPQGLSREWMALWILFLGTLFSLFAGLVIWAFEMRQEKASLESRQQEFQKKSYPRRYGPPRDPEEYLKESATNAICWLSRMIFSDQNKQWLLESAIDLVKKVLRSNDASIMLLDSNKELFIAASSGISARIANKTRVPIGKRVAGRVVRSRTPTLLIGDISRYHQFQDVRPNPRIGSSIVCPLVVQNEVLGVMNLNRRRNSENFTEAHLHYAMIFASQLAEAILSSQQKEAFSKTQKAHGHEAEAA